MKIESMWCVEDPGPVSEMADICYEATVSDIVKSVRGSACAGDTHGLRRLEALSIYTDESEARADAEQRLAARDARAAASTSTGSCRVWEVFGGNVRLFENGDVKHWDYDMRLWDRGWGGWDTSPIVRIDEVRHEEWKVAVQSYRMTSPHSPTSTGP